MSRKPRQKKLIKEWFRQYPKERFTELFIRVFVRDQIKIIQKSDQ